MLMNSWLKNEGSVNFNHPQVVTKPYAEDMYGDLFPYNSYSDHLSTKKDKKAQ